MWPRQAGAIQASPQATTMNAKQKATYYLCRAVHYLRRGLEIWLFTHKPCPSGAVTEILAQENRDQTSRDRALEKRDRGTRRTKPKRH